MTQELDPTGQARTHGTSAPPTPSRGFSLVELLAALLLTVITIMGLAHTLALGYGFIDRYGTGRAALARVNGQLELVRAQVKDGASLAEVDSIPRAILVLPGIPGVLSTSIHAVDDPADGLDSSAPPDYYRVRTAVSWRQAGITDSIEVSTLVFRP